MNVVFYAATLLVALVVHEYAHAWTAVRLGDRTPKLSGRLTLNPRPLIDPFGTLFLPGILLVPILFGRGLWVPFAYAKPLPLNPWSLRKGEKQILLVMLAGPVVNVAMAAVFALLLRVAGSPEALVDLLIAGLRVNIVMAAIHIVPIPPLDGARVLAGFLSTRAREVLTTLEQYGALFILLIFFILPGPIFAFVDAVGNGICSLLVGANCI